LADKTEIMWDEDREFVAFLKQIYSQGDEDVVTSIYRMYEILPLAWKIKQDNGKSSCPESINAFEKDMQAGTDIYLQNWLGVVETIQHELSRSMLLMVLYENLLGSAALEDRIDLIGSIPHERRCSYVALRELYRPSMRCNPCRKSFSRLSSLIAHPFDKKWARELECEIFADVKGWN